VAILIKRYANRKLYNTESSRYITLRGVGELLDRGEEVRVVDNETGEDITQVALSQILVDNKRAREVPSDTLLTQILSRGGDAVYSAIRKSVDEASDGLGEFQERFRQLVHRGDASAARNRPFAWERRGRDEADPDAAFTSAEGAASGSSARNGRGSDPRAAGSDAGPGRSASSSAASAASSAAELGGLIREAVTRAFRADEWPKRDEIDRLNRNLERVAGALERLESALAQSRPRP
jgi:polyhydroxyalkanoate synthesis repressor PhaR